MMNTNEKGGGDDIYSVFFHKNVKILSLKLSQPQYCVRKAYL